MVNYNKLIRELDLGLFPIKVSLSIRMGLLVTKLEVKCRNTGHPIGLEFRRAFLDTDDESEALDYLYWNVQEAFLHEVAECFIHRGQRVFDPHLTEEGDKALLMGPHDDSWYRRGVKLC